MTKFRQSTKRTVGKRAPLWLPYLQSIERTGKDSFKFVYNGGELECGIHEISSIMLYGDYGPLQMEILESICSRGIPIIIHKRNVARPIYVCTPFRPELQETITEQILARQNKTQLLHISRKLLKAKFEGMKWLVPNVPEIPRRASLEKLRSIEAHHSKRYWREYYGRLGYPRGVRRGKGSMKGSIAMALDAQSKFLSGLLLRWITYHHLSPFHGFLHVQADYPALIYDLIEPYRAHFEKIAFLQLQSANDPDRNKGVVGMVIEETKSALDEEVYTGLTRQIVTRHELLHGIVLALKAYLLGDHTRFMIPTVDYPTSGRPRKVKFRLYGRYAGRTDYWDDARAAAQRSLKLKLPTK